jgi:hypothetical protein
LIGKSDLASDRRQFFTSFTSGRFRQLGLAG